MAWGKTYNRQKNMGPVTKAPEIIDVDFANSKAPDEVALYEPSHLDLHFLPSSL